MFCPYCGTSHDAQSSFCFNCGKPLPTDTSPTCVNEQLTLLERMTAHFSQKAKQYEAYDKVCQQIPYYGPGASKPPLFEHSWLPGKYFSANPSSK